MEFPLRWELKDGTTGLGQPHEPFEIQNSAWACALVEQAACHESQFRQIMQLLRGARGELQTGVARWRHVPRVDNQGTV
jgi:GAF domain-containing protein